MQPGELIENDNEWARSPTHKEQETLRKQLAQMIPEGTDIHFAVGNEHTEWVEQGAFRESIADVTSHKKKTAKVVSQHIDTHGETFFWIDD